ncbi:M36 family metallopeptidase [Chroococcidiopsis sp. SAG 2025]|uniref:M36 family metallopeptidase n=1 Tax=Chroococcidiopsis sp. SAG 2025 TaxID=171389 RepID=UPI002936D6CA|nr:M36 family metallopeptidase [Chroococcidiopsis sp. SAG 2025]
MSNNAPSTEGALIDQALNFVTQTSAAFGFAPSDPVEFVPDPTIETTSADSLAIHLQQTYHGIPVFQMVRTVRFSSRREISEVVGNNVDLPNGINIAPQIDVNQAVTAAAQYVATSDEAEEMTDGWGQPMAPITVDLSDYVPQVLAAFPMPSQPTVLDKGPFANPISAHLVLFYQNPETRLGWYVLITLPGYQEQYEVIVSADRFEPEILYCQSLMHTAVEANVYTENPGRTPRKIVAFPRDLNDYPVPRPSSLPPQFPGRWCTNDNCVGNNTIAALWEEIFPEGEREIKKLQGQMQNGNVVFNPDEPTGDEQKILNIFYFCNYMHDFFYLLGFTEAVGNFQEMNYTGQGTASDPVDARAFRGPVRGTANMLTLQDGRKPIMNMGLVASTGRHTAFDADVVFHEFVHGVTNRLVGGRMNSPQGLQQPQSRGMGEGWSDYFALTIQNFGKSVEEEKVVTGDWVVDDSKGIRFYPYDSNFPHGFGNIGKDRYVQEHNIGEIWCATLMEMNRKIGQALGSQDRGHQIGWQIVVDGLKLSPSNPSFLDERDAILKALDDLHTVGRLNDADYTEVRRAVWTAFAKFGMGPNADCSGASLNGIVKDTNLPPGL